MPHPYSRTAWAPRAVFLLLLSAALAAPSSAQPAQELLPQRILNFSFGSGVAISGHRLAVSGGAPVRHPVFNSDVPSIDVYRFDGDAWAFEANLISDDPVFWNKLGSAVRLVDSTVVVGTPATGKGAALDFAFDGTAWVERSRIESNSAITLRDNFGFFISMRDGVLVVGDNDDWDGFDRRQVAYVFRHDGADWQLEDTLSSGEVNNDLGYGVSVAASDDVVVVGAPFYSGGRTVTREGAAYVYERDGAGWTETQQLSAEEFTIPDARFGQAVATDGRTIVVGAVRDSVDGAVHAGAAYVFRKEGGTWTLKQQLVASTVEAYANFGLVVAVSADRLLIGAPSDTRFENTGGSAYLYQEAGSEWVERARLVHADPAPDDRFGTSVALDGDWAVVGAPGRRQGPWRPGAAYVFPISMLVSTEGSTAQDSELSLSPVYPNPFAGSVTLSFEIPSSEGVRLEVFDLLGRRVATVIDATLPAGRHEYAWEGHNLAAGLYAFRLQAGRATVVAMGVMTNSRR